MSDTNNKIFKPELESIEEFLERFKLQNFTTLANLKPEEKSKKAMLLANSLPVEVVTDIQRKLKPTLLSAATFEDIETQLTSLFSQKKSFIGSAVTFFTRKQQSGETVESFAKVLNELSSQCNYGECCRDKLVRDVFVSGLRSTKLMTALIHECEGKTFGEVLTRAKIIEQVNIDIEVINPSVIVYSQNMVKSKFEMSAPSRSFNGNSTTKSGDKNKNEYGCTR